MEKNGLKRRQFIGYMGTGLLTASLGQVQAAGSILPHLNDIDKHLTPEDKKPVPKIKTIDPTEREEGDYPTPVSPEKKIGFAIVGIGDLALNEVLPAFAHSKYAKPVALVSGHADKAKKVAGQYGISEKNIYSYQTFDDIKNNPEVDVVYIILPNNMHREFTIRAAKAGKHVLCEKPMALSPKECEDMIAACKNANRKLMIAYRIQYEPNNAQCRDWVQSKEYGNVKLLEFFNGQHNGDPNQWRLKKSMGGGSMMDVGIYCLNTCRYLLGEEPEAVFANTFSTPGDERFKEVDETMLFQLYFPSGVRASCSTTLGAHQSRRYRAVTDKGAWFGMDPAFDYKGLRMEFSQAKGKQEWKSNPAMEEKNQFALELDHISTCIYDDTKPFTPGEEGLQDHRIIEALFQSAKEGKIIKLEKITGKDVFRGTKPEQS